VLHDKKQQGGKTQHKASGSVAWNAAARAGFRAGRTKEGRTAITLAKWNNAGVCKAIEYKIASRTIDKGDGTRMDVGSLEWLGECDILPGDFDYDERKSGDRDSSSKAERAEQIILEMLADGNSKPQAEVVAACEVEGISEGTVMRAKKKLANVKSTKGHSSWSWQRTDAKTGS
jgi:hypothetical protein